MQTAPRQPDTSLLLYCPEQGGWHVGEWWEADGPGRWVAVISPDIKLEPSFWALPPVDPQLG